jgi:hypothetical protein
MSDSPWNEEGAPPAPKKSIPTWAWWVGGGCLFLLVIVGVGGFFAYRYISTAAKEWGNADLQWENVKKVLPYDKRPEGVVFQTSFHIGMDFWLFNDSRGYMVMLMQLPGTNGEHSRKQLLDEHSNNGFLGKFGRHGQERLKLRVQGRELEALRFVQEIGDRPEGNEPGTGPGATLIVDLTPEDAERPLVLQMTRRSGGDEPFDTQAAIDFLEPFHVGSQR